jgi:hypothetical protein
VPTNAIPRALAITALIATAMGAVAACGSSATAPSGPCTNDEQTAAELYGPPQGVSMSGDTTTYTWGGSKILFIAQGDACVEKNGGQ